MIEKWIDTKNTSSNRNEPNQSNNQQSVERQSFYFGCFKYDPAIIGPKIKRPLTPFVNDIQNDNR